MLLFEKCDLKILALRILSSKAVRKCKQVW